MAEYWLFFLGSFVLGGITRIALDYAISWHKRQRQAKTVARRLGLLREFAQGKRVA